MSDFPVKSGSTYYLQNVITQTVVDLSAGDGTTVTGYALNYGNNQRWTVTDNGDNTWSIRNVGNQGYLAVQGTPYNGAPVVATTSPFAWNICRDKDGSNNCRFYVVNTNFNLDLAGGSNVSGTNVQVWTTWGTNNQLFTPSPV